MARPADTDAEAWVRQFEALRSLSPQARLRIALTMSEDVKEIARAGIRHRHTDWPDERVQAALDELLLGVDLARRARAARPG
jgi:predicted transcriptional regulator